MPDDYPRAYVYRQVVRAKLYIDAHFTLDLDLGRTACEACYSRHHFHRLFRQMYGMTPQRYRRRVRMDRAKQLLASGTPVTEVCLEVGYDSLSTFSASFKSVRVERHDGQSPARIPVISDTARVNASTGPSRDGSSRPATWSGSAARDTPGRATSSR